LLPPFDSGEDAFWVGGPDEGFGIDVCLRDEAVDGDLQINDRSEHATLEALARELGEEAFDRVEPGCRGRGEVERPAGMPRQPLAHLWMLVGRIIVDHRPQHAAPSPPGVHPLPQYDRGAGPCGKSDTHHLTVPSRMLRAANSVVVP